LGWNVLGAETPSIIISTDFLHLPAWRKHLSAPAYTRLHRRQKSLIKPCYKYGARTGVAVDFVALMP
jgi:hypothetical protein